MPLSPSLNPTAHIEILRCHLDEPNCLLLAAARASVQAAIDRLVDETQVVFRFGKKTVGELHTQDEDCTVVDGECVACRVTHLDECRECGARGFHRPTCPDNDERVSAPEFVFTDVAPSVRDLVETAVQS